MSARLAFWRKDTPPKPSKRAELEKLSARQLEKLYWHKQQEKREPELRAEERRLGTTEWETLTYMQLLTRSIDRYRESRRPADLRQAKRLGIADAEALSTNSLHWAVFDAETRERRIRELS